MSSSAYFDIIFSLPLIWGIYSGFSKGLIVELAALISLVLGIFGGIKFSGLVSELLNEKLGITSQYLPIISFTAIFMLIVITIYLLARLIETIVNIASLKLINKIAGAILGFLKTGVIIFILLFIIKAIDEKAKLLPEEIKNESLFYKIAAKIPFDLGTIKKNSKNILVD